MALGYRVYDATAIWGDDNVVLDGTGGVWRVLGDDGAVREASLRGRLKKSDEGRRADGTLRRDTVASESRRGKLAVGDRVTLGQRLGDGEGLCAPVHASVSGTVVAVEVMAAVAAILM